MRRRSSFSRERFGVRNRAPWLTIFRHALHQFHENDLFTSAAAMSYFGLLTLFPALLLLLSLSNIFVSNGSILDDMLTRVVQVYPGSGDFLRTTVTSLSKLSTGVLITCAVVVLWAGSWIFAVIERALNRIWGTTSRPFWRGRALTLGMIGVVGLVLLTSAIATSINVSLQDLAARVPMRVLERSPVLALVSNYFWQVLFIIVSVSITITLFILVFRFMPNARVTIRDTLPGAILGGLLWELFKYIFARSLHFFHYDQLYGPVGAVVSVLTWSYVSSLVLLFGAQLTAVCHREHPTEKIPATAADAAIAPMP